MVIFNALSIEFIELDSYKSLFLYLRKPYQIDET